MALITNIQHFLDENGNVPELNPEAIELLKFLTAIIEAASISYDRPVTFADTKCQTMINSEPCTGEIEVWVDPDSNIIGWECLECEEEGTISEWEGTQWDMRNYVLH